MKFFVIVLLVFFIGIDFSTAGKGAREKSLLEETDREDEKKWFSCVMQSLRGMYHTIYIIYIPNAINFMRTIWEKCMREHPDIRWIPQETAEDRKIPPAIRAFIMEAKRDAFYSTKLIETLTRELAKQRRVFERGLEKHNGKLADMRIKKNREELDDRVAYPTKQYIERLPLIHYSADNNPYLFDKEIALFNKKHAEYKTELERFEKFNTKSKENNNGEGSSGSAKMKDKV